MKPSIKSCLKRLLLPQGMRAYKIRGGALRGRWFHFNLQEDTQVWRGVYEQALQEWLLRVMHPEAVAIDVGAAEGWATLQMALLAPEGRVIAFEPSERGDWIDRNLRLNDDVPLAAVDHERQLVGCETRSGSEHQLPMISLDDYVAAQALPRVDVIKIDVDGPEVQVLEGAARMLRRWRPHLCVEAHSRELADQVLELLANHGYSLDVFPPPRHEHRSLDYIPLIFASQCA